MVYRLILSYCGERYAGWQRQPNAMTVQESVETALGHLMGSRIKIAGAGRTDAGVHARGQVAHLLTASPETAIPEMPLRALVHGTNHHLPEDIRVFSAARVPSGFDARKCAVGKQYSYHLVTTLVLSPLDAPFALGVDYELDLGAMRRALDASLGLHDFSAFALAGGSHNDPHRRVFEAELEHSGSKVRLTVSGEGFLRGMVRSLVGTLLEVGRGRRSVESFEALLRGAPRAEAGPTAPPHGLVLDRVDYPERWAPIEEYDARDSSSPVVD